MADLVERDMLTAEQATVLAESVRRGDNILISGGTSSGKTTLLNVLADCIPAEERILILEDTAELRIRKPHVVSAETQLDTNKTQIGFGDLLKAALRHRPDRIIVGEIRGAEARIFLDALNTGHRGSLSTIHANSTTDAISRLTALALRGQASGDIVATRAEVERSLDRIVHVTRDGGIRRVAEMHTVRGAARASI